MSEDDGISVKESGKRNKWKREKFLLTDQKKVDAILFCQKIDWVFYWTEPAL